MKLIIQEKRNDIINEIINLILIVLFSSVIYLIVNLMYNMSVINDSKWFNGYDSFGRIRDQFMREQTEKIEFAIKIYGAVMIIVMLIMLILMTKKNLDRMQYKNKIMHMIGYSKVQIWCYRIKGIAVDTIICMFFTFLAGACSREYLYTMTGMSNIEKESGIVLEGYYEIILYVMAGIMIYMVLSNGNSIRKKL